ncbi:MAG: alginate O-acetyltransferase AlgX-related protein [Chthoniobacterales bacterium]
MRFFCAILLLALSALSLRAETPSSAAQQNFASKLAGIVAGLEKENAAAALGIDGWLFFGGELRLLSLGHFWGADAAKVSRAHKRELADPLSAIVDFHQQLKAHGIELLLVPVPPKAAIYPEKIVAGFDAQASNPSVHLRQFYAELGAAGIDVLDLTALFIQDRENGRGPVFCKTDSHWSGVGCAFAAQAIAEKVRAKVTGPGAPGNFAGEWKDVQITGDLAGLLPKDAPKPGPEKITLQNVSRKDGAAVEPDANSPLLLMGDSHTLVYHDFLSERAGLVDQLALQLGFAPDLIGTRGSGATPVRINLYRRTAKDPAYLTKKKVVVWCFAAREFTEATEGWAKVPLVK